MKIHVQAHRGYKVITPEEKTDADRVVATITLRDDDEKESSVISYLVESPPESN